MLDLELVLHQTNPSSTTSIMEHKRYTHSTTKRLEDLEGDDIVVGLA